MKASASTSSLPGGGTYPAPSPSAASAAAAAAVGWGTGPVSIRPSFSSAALLISAPPSGPLPVIRSPSHDTRHLGEALPENSGSVAARGDDELELEPGPTPRLDAASSPQSFKFDMDRPPGFSAPPPGLAASSRPRGAIAVTVPQSAGAGTGTATPGAGSRRNSLPMSPSSLAPEVIKAVAGLGSSSVNPFSQGAVYAARGVRGSALGGPGVGGGGSGGAGGAGGSAGAFPGVHKQRSVGLSRASMSAGHSILTALAGQAATAGGAVVSASPSSSRDHRTGRAFFPPGDQTAAGSSFSIPAGPANRPGSSISPLPVLLPALPGGGQAGPRGVLGAEEFSTPGALAMAAIAGADPSSMLILESAATGAITPVDGDHFSKVCQGR